jgi:hypothetical protein
MEDPMTFALGKAHKQGHYQNEGMCEVILTLHNHTLICSNVDDCRFCNPIIMITIDLNYNQWLLDIKRLHAKLDKFIQKG